MPVLDRVFSQLEIVLLLVLNYYHVVSFCTAMGELKFKFGDTDM